ncbi:AraC family transcriptional regulator [Salinicola sp. DM10]|uniref:helix-turn-helix domain-containing protein n=1 Tax=Salinicola sp. DM10 TaxID=2815721 RepID=UPI001A8EEA7F|nr:AraC family transcriptional regulator [Salinicola sp. DM10]MCE3027274.1 AraC family transcriptional regulator [Salinicola sp. DM10]
MSASATPDTPPAAGVAPYRALSVDDFAHFERRYHLAHHFPDFEAGRPGGSRCVVEGRIAECQPWPGCQWVSSDIGIAQTYESHALPGAPAHLSIIVVLEGEAELALGGERCRLLAGQSALLDYDVSDDTMPDAYLPQPLSARHVAQPRVRAINLTLLKTPQAQVSHLSSHSSPPHSPWLERLALGNGCRRLSLSDALLRSLEESLQWPTGAPGTELMTEGLALQMLGQALQQGGGADSGEHRIAETAGALSPRDRALLARVHAELERYPGRAHSLDALARLACMSPSALRRKYRCHYGRSLFDQLREFRLRLAHRLLREGLPVQEAARCAGYRHATNFATAFRQFHGVAPREVRSER